MPALGVMSCHLLNASTVQSWRPLATCISYTEVTDCIKQGGIEEVPIQHDPKRHYFPFQLADLFLMSISSVSSYYIASL